MQVAHLQELLSYARVRPAVNQVEFHPRWQQEELRAFCEREVRAGCRVIEVHCLQGRWGVPVSALLSWLPGVM